MYQRENIFTELFCFVFIWKKDNELQRRYNEILNIGEIPIFFLWRQYKSIQACQLPQIIQLLYSFKQIQDSFEIKEAF